MEVFRGIFDLNIQPNISIVLKHCGVEKLVTRVYYLEQAVLLFGDGKLSYILACVCSVRELEYKADILDIALFLYLVKLVVDEGGVALTVYAGL